jgi:hypothetical protein
MENISEHITYTEATKSLTAIKWGIDNTPNEKQLTNMKNLAVAVFEPLRAHFNMKLGISSFFRSKALNDHVNGSITSQHMADNGAAIDIDADIYGGITNKEIFDYIKDNLDYDQLIWEYGTKENPAWVHVSYKETGNRHQNVYTMR